MKRIAIVTIVIGLAFVALQGSFVTKAQPWPSHVVAGGVVPSAESDYSNAVAYLIDNTSGPLLTQDILTPGVPPIYEIDIGGVNYDWRPGNETVVVFETRNGLNGWVGENWTESAWGVMTSNNQDDLGDTTLQRYPTLTTSLAGPSLVDVSWTGLVNRSSPSGNIKGYRLYRWISGATTPVAIITHVPGALTYRDGPLANGAYCYQVSVLYRRDVAFAQTYETLGRSYMSCLTVAAAPTIVNTVPPDGATNVALNANIQVTFSKQMNRPTVTWTVVPTPPGIPPTFTPNWNTPTDTVLTLTHATLFNICTSYNVRIDGQDMSGQNLVAGLVPNPWDFDTICPAPPKIVNTVPANDAFGVALNANIQVSFSSQMDTATVDWSNIVPAPPTLTPGWNTPTNTILTLTHATDFAICTNYNVTIAGKDTFGQNLVPGLVPNPWDFNTVCPNPQVAWTSPANGETGVDRLAQVIINFTKAMDTTVGQWAVKISPYVPWSSWIWDALSTGLTLSHTVGFVADQLYTVTVAANDTSGNPLSPNPTIWSFTANSPPTVAIVKPTGGCFCGGRTIDLSWTMSDDKTAPADLYVTLTYNYTGSAGQLPITGPTKGITTYPWTAPSIDKLDVNVTVNVTDESNDWKAVTSAPFEIDSTAPTITSTTPSQSATGVILTTAIQMVFSEDMNRTSVQNAITIEPAVTSITYTWTDSKNLQIGHDPFQLHTMYWVNTSTGAKDDCDVGNPLAQAHSFSFTTGGKQPKAPTLNQPLDSDIGDTSISLSWTAVTQYTDDTNIPPAVAVTYQVYRNSQLITTISGTTYKDTGLTPQTQYEYFVKAVADSTPSAESNHRIVTTKLTVVVPPSVDYTWLYVLIIVIIIVVVLVIIALMMMRKKKPEEVPTEEAPPEEGAPPEEVPTEEAPAEEAPPEEAPPAETPPEEAPPEGEAPPST